MVLRFVTKARMRKFETQQRNILIEMGIMRKRIDDLENEVFED